MHLLVVISHNESSVHGHESFKIHKVYIYLITLNLVWDMTPSSLKIITDDSEELAKPTTKGAFELPRPLTQDHYIPPKRQ
jgi:hypothetical protein